MKTLIKKYRSNERGNFGMMTAILMVPLMMAVGFAVDYARLAGAKARLQNAADSASIRAAMAKSAGESTAEITRLARLNFDANTTANEPVTIDRFVVSEVIAGNYDVESMRVVTEARIKPVIMHAFGFESLNMRIISSAAYGSSSRSLEIAVALDATGSMGFGTRWNDAMTAMEGVLDDLKDMTGDDNFNVTLVPFRDRVNIGTNRTSWLIGGTPNNWNGCVEPREEHVGSFQWLLDDDSHQTSKFQASVPGVTGGLSDYQSEWSPNPSPICPNVSIIGPTNNPSIIGTEARKLWQEGTGRFDVGLAWAWRALSPEWSGLWDKAGYPATSASVASKYIVFITDGNSLAYNYELSKEEDLGFNNGSKVGFEHVVELCENIKDDGIEIFVLQPQGNNASIPYFKNCASSDNHYFSIDGVEDFEIAFASITKALPQSIYLTR